MKFVKNQTKAIQHAEAETFTVKKLFAFFIHVIIQK